MVEQILLLLLLSRIWEKKKKWQTEAVQNHLYLQLKVETKSLGFNLLP